MVFEIYIKKKKKNALEHFHLLMTKNISKDIHFNEILR